MEHVDYPPFLFPEPCRGKEARSWTRKEAQLYYSWFMESMDDRISGLLTYLHETLDGSPEEVLGRLGEKIAEAILQPEHHAMGPLDPELQGSVISMCMDMGMLLGRYLTENTCLRWNLHRGGKLDIHRNQPVLIGFPWDPKYPVNPCSLSFRLSHGIIRGDDDGALWQKLYKSNVEFTTGKQPAPPPKD